MKKIFLLFIFFALVNNSCVLAYDIAPVSENTINISNENKNSAKINLSKLEEIEFKLFGKIYSSKALEKRLSKLEKKIFLTTFENLSASQRLDNIISNYNKFTNSPNLALRSISKLEKKIFGQEYNMNKTEDRVDRLEEKLFGAIQTGEIGSRVKSLEIASKNYLNNYNCADLDSNFNTNSSKWNFLGGSFVQGYPTGFTPSITSYNSFNPPSPFRTMNDMLHPPMHSYNTRFHHPSFHRPLPPSNHTQQHSPNAFGSSFRNIGTGSRVTILN